MTRASSSSFVSPCAPIQQIKDGRQLWPSPSTEARHFIRSAHQFPQCSRPSESWCLQLCMAKWWEAAVTGKCDGSRSFSLPGCLREEVGRPSTVRNMDKICSACLLRRSGWSIFSGRFSWETMIKIFCYCEV